MSHIAASHLFSGTLESSKMVPTVTLNWRLQVQHFQSLVTLFLVRLLRVIVQGSVSPHLGQTGPSGQRWRSR